MGFIEIKITYPFGGPDVPTTYIDGDFLLYGTGQMNTLIWDSDFKLYYDMAPTKSVDASADFGYGVTTFKEHDPVDGHFEGRGSANPQDAFTASRALAALGKDLTDVHASLQGGAKALGAKWSGPAHESVNAILHGFDEWVTDVNAVLRPKGDATRDYVGATFDIATKHQFAQQQHFQIADYYRQDWKSRFTDYYNRLVKAAEWFGQRISNLDNHGVSFVNFRTTFDISKFEPEKKKFEQDYKAEIDKFVLDGLRDKLSQNVSWLDGEYRAILNRFGRIRPTPYFAPAPPPKSPDPKDVKSPFDGLNKSLKDLFDPKNLGLNNPGGGGGAPSLKGGGLPSGLDVGGGSPSGLDAGVGGGVPSGLDGGGGLGDPLGVGGGAGVPGGGSGLPSPVTGPDGQTGFDVTGDRVPDLGLNGQALPGGGLPAGSKVVTRPDGSKGVDIDGDGVADLGMDGRATPEGSLPAGTRAITGPNGETGIDVTGDGVPDLGLDGQALPGGALPAGSELATGPDGTEGIDLDGDGIPDIGFDGKALPGGSLPEGTRLVTGPDGTSGVDLTGDGIPDASVSGERLPGSTLFGGTTTPPLADQVLVPGDASRGFPATGQLPTAPLTAAAGVGAAGVGAQPMYPPMMPMGGGMGGMGGGGGKEKEERERQTWLLEDDKVWIGDEPEHAHQLGRPVEEEELEVDEWEAPARPAPARGKPAPGRPGQQPTTGGRPTSRGRG